MGPVIESVACLHDPTQTYALYLPSTYTAERRWPILYAFDPRACGPVPTKLFRAAAERLGYIAVGSNNSRNGPRSPVVAALNAVWRDTHERLALATKYERETQDLFELRQLLERNGPYAKLRIPKLMDPIGDENTSPGDDTTVGSELELRLDRLALGGKRRLARPEKPADIWPGSVIRFDRASNRICSPPA